jgi:acetyltransferase-like isoleucine patch superfamily enzyme
LWDLRPFLEADLDIGSIFILGVNQPIRPAYRLGKSLFSVDDSGSFTTGDGIVRVSHSSKIRVKGKLTIGSGTHIGHSSDIVCFDEISIGDDCAISWRFSALDFDFHDLVVDGQKAPKHAPIVIRDNVWIGNNVSVKSGVTIGNGAVIGSNSVVTNDVPSESLAVGQPAEVISEDVSWTA